MDSLINNVINKTDTVKDLNVSMSLSEFNNLDGEYGKYDTYKLAYVISYKTVLSETKFQFMITNNKAIQNDKVGLFTFCLFIDSSFSGSKIFFEIENIMIAGKRLTELSFDSTDEYVSYEYGNDTLETFKGQEVQVNYKVDFLVRKGGQHFSYFTPFTAKGIHLTFDATATNIERVKLLRYLNSGKEPTIYFTDPEDTIKHPNPKKIEIILDDWILPFSGVTFIWQFERK